MSNQRSAGIVSEARESLRSHSDGHRLQRRTIFSRPVDFEIVKFGKKYLYSDGLVHAAWERRMLEILQRVQ